LKEKNSAFFDPWKEASNGPAPRVRHQRSYEEIIWARKTGRDRVFTNAWDSWARK